MAGDPKPAEHFAAAGREAKDGAVDTGRYVADRFTAPASGDRATDHELKDSAKGTAEEAKEQGVGLVQSMVDGAKYVGSRFTASPSGEEGGQAKAADARDTAQAKASEGREQAKGMFNYAGEKAGEAKEDTKGFLSAAGDKAQEQGEKAKGALQDAGDRARDAYNETQESIAQQLAANPIDEARADGRIPADTQTVTAAKP